MTNTRNKKTILVVDDMPENIDVLAGILNSDYIVKAVTNGKMALQIASSNPPDLIFLDVMMPEMDGREVLKLLKSNERTRRIPVVLVSGKEKSDILSDTNRHDVATYLNKPLAPDEVMKTVRRFIL
jgi:CheY-like chemotaxis protein